MKTSNIEQPVTRNRSLLLRDNKNKPNLNPKHKPQPYPALKSKSTALTQQSSITLTQQSSTVFTISVAHSEELVLSKSEEETKVTENETSEESPRKEPIWSGAVGHYRQQIVQYIVKREIQFGIDSSYLHLQKLLSAKMRVYLVRHIFKICTRFGLMRTTLHLAVLYMDLFFAKRPVLKDQLEGIVAAQACLFIAMKYEEIYPPELAEWVDRRNSHEIIKMEANILFALNFQLSHYTIQHHIGMQLWERGLEGVSSRNVRLLSDLTLFDLNIRQTPSSQLAKAILALTEHEEDSNSRVALSVKWMVERNGESLAWLQEHKYGFIEPSELCCC